MRHADGGDVGLHAGQFAEVGPRSVAAIRLEKAAVHVARVNRDNLGFWRDFTDAINYGQKIGNLGGLGPERGNPVGPLAHNHTCRNAALLPAQPQPPWFPNQKVQRLHVGFRVYSVS